jgi:hypothetical protein
MLTDVDKLLTFPSDKLQRWRHPRHEWSPQRPNSRCPESDSGCVAVLWRFLIYIYIPVVYPDFYQNLPESTRMNWSRFVVGSCWINFSPIWMRIAEGIFRGHGPYWTTIQWCDGGCHPSTFTMPAHHDCSWRSSTSEVPLAGSAPTAPSQTWHVAFGSPIITYRMIWCLVFAQKIDFWSPERSSPGLVGDCVNIPGPLDSTEFHWLDLDSAVNISSTRTKLVEMPSCRPGRGLVGLGCLVEINLRGSDQGLGSGTAVLRRMHWSYASKQHPRTSTMWAVATRCLFHSFLRRDKKLECL